MKFNQILFTRIQDTKSMSLAKAQQVITIEAEALRALAKKLDQNFLKAIDLIVQCPGRVIITGMGKTGIIGRKIAATFSSTGTPSLWMHSAEAIHGDLGQVTANDCLLIISYSGETEETKRLLPLVKKIGAKIIALTGQPKSSLAKMSDVVLNVSVKKEGCPLGLAPMASTTATLAMGDALAACLIERKGFKKEDFAFYHPGGNLGKKLNTRVEDLMRKNTEVPRVVETAKVKDVLLTITKKRCGSACIVGRGGRFIGIFTDGDLRRHLEKDLRLLEKEVSKVMTRGPIVVRPQQMAIDALKILKEKKIDELPVVNEQNRLVGLLDVQDLLKAGIV